MPTIESDRLNATVPVLDPTPRVLPKAAVGSIWATVRTNVDERAAANAFLNQVFITTDGWILHSHPTRQDAALPILEYRLRALNDLYTVNSL